MTNYKPIKEGKVREIYDNGDSLIMVATDRISCFDVILHNEVSKKGAVLTQMSKFWFDMTKDIIPNHMLSVNVKDMPEFDPDAEISSLTLTIPSWQSSIERTKNTADLTSVSPQAKGNLVRALNELSNTIADLLLEMEDNENG